MYSVAVQIYRVLLFVNIRSTKLTRSIYIYVKQRDNYEFWKDDARKHIIRLRNVLVNERNGCRMTQGDFSFYYKYIRWVFSCELNVIFLAVGRCRGSLCIIQEASGLFLMINSVSFLCITNLYFSFCRPVVTISISVFTFG